MKKNGWIAAFVLTIVFGFTANAVAAYSISWFNVGYRAYENGNQRFQMDIEFADDNGNNVATDILESVVLRGPSGNDIPLDDLSFNVTPAMGYDNYYDGWNGLWIYNGYMENPYGGYVAILSDDLTQGTYTVTCRDTSGNTYRATKDFYGKQTLPIVSGSSIKARYDNRGNLMIRWAGINSGFPYLIDPDMTSSIRLCIGSDQSWWQMNVPAHMSTALIPGNILNMIKSVGGNHYLLIQYRQNTNCNRSYSNSINLP